MGDSRANSRVAIFSALALRVTQLLKRINHTLLRHTRIKLAITMGRIVQAPSSSADFFDNGAQIAHAKTT
ncbi:hypothetical protein B7453_04990 [Pseudomonas sp. IB20]|uniref:hypothetical protein n=1 Tax=Pseudomonas sp. IB20 TaxID=1702250 RepID=UPI000BCD159E|nr:MULTISPECIES: hypothetical protein [unclassified Pseudomonas]MCV2229827.1 hypothetical protein [Pseudomonas sp. AU10]OZO05642.1 hypothetical protein B7453_04990 [Pseudomonas sp. IB20]